MLRRLKLLVVLLALSLVLAGCNRVGLAYRNLDVIIPWTLSDYLDMNAGQKSWFNDNLKAHLAWHCTTQLPGYLDWLDRLQQMADNRQVSDAALQARTAEAKQAIGEIARQITPSAIELLQGLDDQQVQDMNNALAKDLRKRQDEYLKPPLAQQIQERAERMSKRLDAWIGPLSASQQSRVNAWSVALGEQNQAWVGNRARWQAHFVAAVQQRHDADFPQKIQQLLVDRESLWTPQYRSAYAQTEAAARSLIIDLMAESTPAQRQKLSQKIDKVRSDFQALKCLKSAQS
jgi:DNA-binding protein H-NS